MPALAALPEVSPGTVRNDMNALAGEKQLVRVNGGGVANCVPSARSLLDRRGLRIVMNGIELAC